MWLGRVWKEWGWGDCRGSGKERKAEGGREGGMEGGWEKGVSCVGVRNWWDGDTFRGGDVG